MLQPKILRVLALVAFSLAAVFNLLGGAGTSCVAINPGRFESMASLAPYAWLYWIFTVAGIATGLYGTIAVVALLRRAPRSTRHIVFSLLAQLAVASAHAYASLSLRGSGTPANMRAIVTGAALILFAFGYWFGSFDPAEEGATEDADNPREPMAEIAGCALGAAAVLLGMERLMALTHTFDGINYAAVWHTGLVVSGFCALGVGGVAFALAVRRRRGSHTNRALPEPTGG